ncbi:MAG: hypothetical protein ACPGOV_11940 [Magnetovibrionaceae bacterium]
MDIEGIFKRFYPGTVAIVSADGRPYPDNSDPTGGLPWVPFFDQFVVLQDGATLPDAVEFRGRAAEHDVLSQTEALTRAKSAAKAGIDEAAEQIRQRFITPGDGQAMVYQRKADEAKAIAEDPDPQPETYPLAAKRAARLQISLLEVAQEWQSQAEAWINIAAVIEDIREEAKEAVDAAADEAAIQGVLDGVDWSVVG